MRAHNKTERKLNICFGAGFLLGILCFVVIYGFAVLNFNADGWVFKSDNDLRQHYVGFMAYRDSAWTFPLGMTDKLSFPYEMSVVYTDSIPLLAFLCKIFGFLLPRPFQYFGWFALFSFAMTGGFAAKLLARGFIRSWDKESYEKNSLDKEPSDILLALMSGLGAIFFVISFVMLQRTFYHTSLTAQWIILLSLDLWFGNVAEERISKRMITYAGMGVLCAGIHTYFLPMSMAILLGSSLELAVAKKKLEKKNIFETILLQLTMAATAGLTLFVFGAFAGETQGEYWVGDFTMNLNTFINSMGKSRVFKELGLYGPMQFEGAAFLGLGIWFLISLALVFSLVELKKGKSFRAGFKNPRRISIIIISLILMILAVSPVFSFGEQVFIRLPYTRMMNKLFGIFRSNGRFVWPVMHIVMLWSIEKIFRLFVKAKKAVVIAILSFALLLQIFDYSPWIGEKMTKYHSAQKTYRTVWDEVELPEGYKGFISFETDNSFMMGTAYYAMRHGMTVNRFYFARDIDQVLNETAQKELESICDGAVREDYIYVFDKDTYEAVKDLSRIRDNMYFYKTRKCIFGVKNEIEAMQIIDDSQVDEVSWQ